MNDDISLSELRETCAFMEDYDDEDYDDEETYKAKQTLWLDLCPKKDAHLSPSEIKTVEKELESLVESFYKEDFQRLDKLQCDYVIEYNTDQDISFLRGDREYPFWFHVYIDIDEDYDVDEVQFNQDRDYDRAKEEFLKYKTLSKFFDADLVEFNASNIEHYYGY